MFVCHRRWSRNFAKLPLTSQSSPRDGASLHLTCAEGAIDLCKHLCAHSTLRGLFAHQVLGPPTVATRDMHPCSRQQFNVPAAPPSGGLLARSSSSLSGASARRSRLTARGFAAAESGHPRAAPTKQKASTTAYLPATRRWPTSSHASTSARCSRTACTEVCLIRTCDTRRRILHAPLR